MYVLSLGRVGKELILEECDLLMLVDLDLDGSLNTKERMCSKVCGRSWVEFYSKAALN